MRVSPKIMKIILELNLNSFYIIKIESLTTLIREYLLIKNLRTIDNIGFMLDPYNFKQKIDQLKKQQIDIDSNAIDLDNNIENIDPNEDVNNPWSPNYQKDKITDNAKYHDILNNKSSPHSIFIPKPISIDPQIKSQLVTLLNESQMNAVEQSCTSDSFVSLIHGPPGTGKTQVILGILSL